MARGDGGAAPLRGVEFRVGRREIGHLHGDGLADLPFPVKVRERLVADGKALPHHVLPDSGWVSLPLRGAASLAGALELFRLSYDRVVAAQRGRDTVEPDEAEDAATRSPSS